MPHLHKALSLVAILVVSVLLNAFSASCFELHESKIIKNNGVKNFIVRRPVKLLPTTGLCAGVALEFRLPETAAWLVDKDK